MEQLETFGPLMFNTTKPSDNGPSKFGASVRSGTANPCVLEPTGTKEADGARAKRGAAARPARDAAPAFVAFFLLRVAPELTLHLHGGRFDEADRQFASIGECATRGRRTGLRAPSALPSR